jgi:hypothetical protein
MLRLESWTFRVVRRTLRNSKQKRSLSYSVKGNVPGFSFYRTSVNHRCSQLGKCSSALLLLFFFKPVFRFGHRPALFLREPIALHLCTDDAFTCFGIPLWATYDCFDSFRCVDVDCAHRILVVFVRILMPATAGNRQFLPTAFFHLQ